MSNTEIKVKMEGLGGKANKWETRLACHIRGNFDTISHVNFLIEAFSPLHTAMKGGNHPKKAIALTNCYLSIDLQADSV